MTLTEARALVPGLAASMLDEQAQARALETLALVCQQFTPRVMVDAPQAILLDITGCERVHGGEVALVENVQATFRRLGYSSVTALADNATAAYARALGDNRKPESLPLEALRLESALVATLRALGVCRLGELLALPAESLPARFGDALVSRLRQFRGELEEDFEVYRLPEVPSERLDFTDPTGRRDALLFALRRAATGLSEQLNALGCGALRLEVSMRASEGAPLKFSVDLSRPAQDSRSLAAVLLGRFETLDTGEAWFEGLELSAPSRAQVVGRQRDLFAQAEPAHEAGFIELVDELVGRLGVNAVSRAELTPDPRPERSYRYVTFDTTQAAQVQVAPGRALTFFEPHPVELDLDEQGLPSRWHEGRRSRSLTCVRGPERVDFAWWEGGKERDYFEVEDEEGARYWLFTQDGRWLMTGAS